VANNLITMQAIARRALAYLYNQAVFAGLVYRDFDPDFSGKQGDTVTIKSPAVFQANVFNRGTGIVLQDAIEGSQTAQLNTLADVSFAVTAEELTLKIDDFATQFLNPAMEAIVQKVDGDLAAAAIAMAVNGGDTQNITGANATDIITAANHGLNIGDKVVFPSLTGGAGLTAGTTVYFVVVRDANTFQVSATQGGAVVNFTTDITAGTVARAGGGTATKGAGTGPQALIDARTKLTTNKISNVNRFTVVSPDEAGVLLKDPLFLNADQRGDTDGLIEASIGRKLGFDNYESQVYSGVAAGVACQREALALVSRTLSLPKGKQGDTAAVANYKGFGLRVVYDYDITKKQDVVSVDFLYGVKKLRPGAAVKLDLT
jgi:hypothetical protein